MVIRYTLKCDHCSKTTLLRLGVGNDEVQKLEFECENCSQHISVTLTLTKAKDGVVSFNVIGASQIPTIIGEDIFAQTTDYVFVFHPTFGHSKDEPVLTPFLQAFGRNKDDFVAQMKRIAFLNTLSTKGSPDLSRIIRNYTNENWLQFESSVREYIPDDWQVSLPIDRNRALYQILEFFVSPVVTSTSHSELILSLTKYTAGLLNRDAKLFDDFIAVLEGSDILREVQYGAFDLVERFLKLTDEFRPIIVDWDFDNPDKEPPDLVIKARVDFHDIKSFYVDAYELICKSLTIITGLINLDKRGHYDKYPVHPTMKNFAPKSILSFHDLANAPKIVLLEEEPLFKNWISHSLDPKLRNAIGHNSTRYVKTKEEIGYVVDKKTRKTASINYGTFLAKALRAFVRTHQVNHLVKIMYIHKYLPRSST